MNILSNCNSLAWTISDNTSGSSKSKRGRAEKPKAAPSTQDVLSNSISKYLGASAKMEYDNAARQLDLQAHQLKLEERKVALQKMEQGYGIAYGGPRPDLQQYHGQGYGIPYNRPGHDQQHFEQQGYMNSSRRLGPDLHYDRSGY